MLAKRKRLYTKKYLERKKRKADKISTVGRYLGPLTPQIKTNLLYCERLSLNSGIGGTASVNVFSANGLYDPDITNVGHQPRGFDQIMALYDHYVVIASKITVHFGSTNAEVYDHIGCIAVLDTTSTSSSHLDYSERPVSKLCNIPSGPSAPMSTISVGVNPNAFLGRSSPLSDPDLKGSSASNPVEQALFHVAAWPIQTVDAGDINIYVRIEYTAIFIEPKNVGSS